ncbi:hypothetical protein O6H91_08G068800 [Diphasiastrum complanatum]|uniref:Uncharacterized protein n=1 Tax=Diphasiastrum complanatum TaxID=34168 RepID=A0ACC2CYL1_DIPCM|nr:hypothetical protein O6H91_08G068800 [Diphasiastrum complanatum]
MAQALYVTTATIIPSTRLSPPLPRPLFHSHSSSTLSGRTVGFPWLVKIAEEHEWRKRTAGCRSNARLVCLGGDDQAREAARKALESALGGKKELFNKWDEEIKKRESGGVGGGSGGRGGQGGHQQDGNSWEEAKQIFFAFTGLTVIYLLITQGRSILAFTVNGILFALRGFKRSSHSATISPSLRPVTPQGSGTAEAHVISKWGRE